MMVESFMFNRIGDKIGDLILLNDLNLHRSFWHKVWEGGFSESQRWEVDLDVKYFYALDLEDKAIAKLETRKKITKDNSKEGSLPDRRKIRAKLKSGLEISLEALNELLPSLSMEKLSKEYLEALKTPQLEKYYNQVARINVVLKGRSGDTGTLWTYPEVCIHNMHIAKAKNINDLGQVIELEEVKFPFPRPAMIHFIGTKST